LFSGSKQIAIDRRACLGNTVFEELVIMKSAWGPELYDMAAWNAAQRDEVTSFDYQEMLEEDNECDAWNEDHRDNGWRM
jgi:hypothetical protein